MAACQAVFDTHELIEAILVELPPFELQTVKDVCTTWRAVIERSKIFPPTKALFPVFESFTDSPLMMCPQDTAMTLNPALPQRYVHSSSNQMWNRAGRPAAHFTHIFAFDSQAELDGLRGTRAKEFVTLPPVTCISFEYCAPYLREPEDAIQNFLFVSSGVRLGDVEAVVRKIWGVEGVGIYARIKVQETSPDEVTLT